MGRLGFGEIMIIALVALLLFGATRIADIGKGLGEGIKNFKRGLKDGDDFDDPGAPKQLPKAEEGEKKALAPAAGPLRGAPGQVSQAPSPRGPLFLA